MLISVDPNGNVVFIYTDELADLIAQGDAVVTRASHVEPNPTGGWTADMAPVDGPVLGPFNLRSDALQEEVSYLEDLLFNKKGN